MRAGTPAPQPVWRPAIHSREEHLQAAGDLVSFLGRQVCLQALAQALACCPFPKLGYNTGKFRLTWNLVSDGIRLRRCQDGFSPSASASFYSAPDCDCGHAGHLSQLRAVTCSPGSHSRSEQKRHPVLAKNMANARLVLAGRSISDYPHRARLFPA